MDIVRQDGKASGRYVATLPGGAEAQVTFYMESENVMVVDHTFVPPQFRGGGIAGQLTERLIEDARASGVKIRPQCPYTATKFRRHPEWSDLLADK